MVTTTPSPWARRTRMVGLGPLLLWIKLYGGTNGAVASAFPRDGESVREATIRN